jgi:chorismate--pyruvate lyase
MGSISRILPTSLVSELVPGSPILYAVQAPRYQPTESKWRDYHHLRSDQLPAATKAWLLDSGSLTARLISASNNSFRVQVLAQQWQRPRLSERRLLKMSHRDIAIVREVALLCGGVPWVFARSVIPAASLTGSLNHLRKLSGSPLGAMLFSDPSMRRAAFQLAKIAGDSEQIPTTLRQSEALWGRRSRFELQGKALMVSELFLPTFCP